MRPTSPVGGERTGRDASSVPAIFVGSAEPRERIARKRCWPRLSTKSRLEPSGENTALGKSTGNSSPCGGSIANRTVCAGPAERGRSKASHANVEATTASTAGRVPQTKRLYCVEPFVPPAGRPARSAPPVAADARRRCREAAAVDPFAGNDAATGGLSTESCTGSSVQSTSFVRISASVSDTSLPANGRWPVSIS